MDKDRYYRDCLLCDEKNKEMNEIKQNITDFVSHVQHKKIGHDPFVTKYHDMVTLECMNINNKKAHKNRHDVRKEREALDNKLQTLKKDREHTVEQYTQNKTNLQALEKKHRHTVDMKQFIDSEIQDHTNGSDIMWSEYLSEEDMS